MSALRGVFSAVLTPLTEDLRPDADVAIPYYRSLLDRGLDGLNVLGTTGEAMSLGLHDRLHFMEAIAKELPVDRCMVGTGASALSDAAQLTRAALDLGFAAALVIPPFYYRGADDDGIVAFYGALFERVKPPARSILLYNFPRMSGYTFHPALLQRLIDAFGETIAGIKDSSNERQLEEHLAHSHPDLAIFPGSETLLGFAREVRLAGCISGSVCLWPELAKRAWEGDDRASVPQLASNRVALGEPLIARVRERVAEEQDNPAWMRSIPPLGTP